MVSFGIMLGFYVENFRTSESRINQIKEIICNIDENNNVWAYDPYYGRLSATPFNENRYYPFPKYRVAFGVKKI